MNVNDYLDKVYEDPPCWLLVSDVYSTELGQGVTDYRTITRSIRAIANTFRLALHKGPEGLSPITDPVDFAIVLLGKSAALGIHHCGIYYGGSVLHALPSGNLYQDMASIQDAYTVMEFWARA